MQVLIVDDEYIQRVGLSNFVPWRELGYQSPDCAESGAAALSLMHTTDYDVIITDVCMPDMTGLELIRQYRKESTHDPCFIILSGFDEFSFAQQAIELGVHRYVLKPIKIEELTSILRTVWHERNRAGIGLEPKKTDPRSHPVIEQILLYISRHYQENITVNQLAEINHINASYLSTLFKEEVGITLSAYLTRYKMRKAAELLKGGQYKIYEIAEMLGYQTPAYFSEQFRKEFGCNPKQYR